MLQSYYEENENPKLLRKCSVITVEEIECYTTLIWGGRGELKGSPQKRTLIWKNPKYFGDGCLDNTNIDGKES